MSSQVDNYQNITSEKDVSRRETMERRGNNIDARKELRTDIREED